jgi:hypothetical protein
MDAFPRLANYLAGLPEGLKSYPACLAKGSLLRIALEKVARRGDYSDLPKQISAVLDTPPLPTTWIPEVVSVAAHYAVADGENLSDDDVVAWNARSLDSLGRSAMYRAITLVASPALLVRAAPVSWRILHRGIELTARAAAEHAEIVLTHPPRLWPSLVHEVTAAGFRVAIAAAGGKAARVDITRCTDTGASYAATWRS